MEEYLNQGIKDVIGRFPEVGDILNDYDIGCVPCAVGSCLLKDIIGIHDLSPEDELGLMTRISGVISPGETPPIPVRQAKPRSASVPNCSPPIQKLVDEHVLIMRLISLIPRITENLDVESEEGRQVVVDGVDFIRSFADKHHHAKEEDILLEYFDNDMDIIKTIRQDHETGRAHVRATAEALEAGDRKAVKEHLAAYCELLTEHITKEDRVLYPWMERNLSTTQVGELFARFNAKDEESAGTPQRYEDLVNRLEREYSQKETAR